ncbi:branched-chain amino acid ABC transporter permease [Actinomadura sp. NBRC 104412]|uniref:branched-chain amino acid ABC transporter permease n=1 Tax=Actinomadura sp. NBRC 104412 TaxID=3032203 RepID=UPI0024A06114|nr:branched-chain amino acid ABC transporter permease [Actinomadura sp. NBRC 104412]GLZ02769.1 branched-chain amino acid ABC transporter permease [Actinomadura sp. NBRC 104412]
MTPREPAAAQAATKPDNANKTDKTHDTTETSEKQVMRDPLRAVRPPDYRRHHFLAIAVFVVLVALIAPQVATSRSSQFLVNLWLVYSIAALGFYLVFGLAGRFAFCQTFMMAFGGYTSAWITRGEDGQPFWVGVASAMLVTALVAGVVGALVHKAQHFYFAIATFAVTQVGMVVFQRADGFTGPHGQAVGIDPPRLFGYEFVKDGQVFWLFLGTLGLCLLLTACIERSPMRREAIAARDNGLVASLSGVAVQRVQLVLFMLGSALGGLAGSLIGHWQGVIGTESFHIDLAIGIFLMLLLGGINSMWGPLIGAAVFVGLPRVLSGIEEYSSIVYGLMLLAVVLLLPNGIAEAVRRFAGRVVPDRLMRKGVPFARS